MHCLSVYTMFMYTKNILLFSNLYVNLRKVVITFYLFSIFQIIREILMFTPTIKGKNKLPSN